MTALPRGNGLGIRVSEEFAASNPDADPTATEMVLNVLTAGGLLLAQLDLMLRPFHLTPGSFNILQIVAGADGPVSPSQIAERFPVPVTTATVTGVLDTLERRALVARSPHPDDRRRVLVRLTDAGRQLLAELLPELFVSERKWAGGLTKPQRAQLVDLLGLLQAHWAAAEKP